MREKAPPDTRGTRSSRRLKYIEALDVTELRRRVGLLDAESRILEMVARRIDIAETMREFLAMVVDACSADAGTLHLLDVVPRRMSLLSQFGLGAGARASLTTIDAAVPMDPIGLTAYRAEPLTFDVEGLAGRWPRFAGTMRSTGMASVWTQPILDSAGGQLGVITVMHRTCRRIRAADIEALDLLAPVARIAIEVDRQQESLDRADEQLTSLASSLPGVIYQRVVTPDGKIRYTYISDGARDLFGVPAEEIIADPNALFACHAPEYRKTFRERLLAASQALTMWDVEAPIISRDGRHKWSHAIARPNRRPDGSVVWNGIILDATRLKEANLQLVAANRAKSEFLANMSHELRTPLNAIIGFAELMMCEPSGKLGHESYREYVGDIAASGRHLLSVINDILDLSKIEAGKAALDEKPMDILAVLSAALRIVNERISDKKITLDVEASRHLPQLHGDERKVKQILLNLLSNAAKFTPEGGSISVSVEQASDGGLHIAVADTGIGIPEHALETVMQPFMQADQGLSRKYEGTGLGLPLTRAMTELHGGSIELRSTVGQGTTVTIRFPSERSIGLAA